MKVPSNFLVALIVIVATQEACKLFEPEITSTPNGTVSAGQSPVVTLDTPTFSVEAIRTTTALPPSNANSPKVTVSRDTSCQAGPHVNYPLAMIFKVGMSAPVVGRYVPSNYWIIEYPEGAGATCWLWGGFATVVGDLAAVPQVVFAPRLPATPAAAPGTPSTPEQLLASCTATKIGRAHV